MSPLIRHYWLCCMGLHNWPMRAGFLIRPPVEVLIDLSLNNFCLAGSLAVYDLLCNLACKSPLRLRNSSWWHALSAHNPNLSEWIKLPFPKIYQNPPKNQPKSRKTHFLKSCLKYTKTTISLLFPYTATLQPKTTKIRQSLAGKNPI